MVEHVNHGKEGEAHVDHLERRGGVGGGEEAVYDVGVGLHGALQVTCVLYLPNQYR